MIWWLVVVFFDSWWQFFETLVVADGDFNGCVLNGWC